VVDLYQEMKTVFTNPVWFVLYMIGLVSLLFHLLQGFQSAFQTFGINHRRWVYIIKGIGVIYSVVICLLFASMPIAFMVGWLQ
jgi:succinate dehydrogenase / fumarate reductase cytochrome b subunit